MTFSSVSEVADLKEAGVMEEAMDEVMHKVREYTVMKVVMDKVRENTVMEDAVNEVMHKVREYAL